MRILHLFHVRSRPWSEGMAVLTLDAYRYPVD